MDSVGNEEGTALKSWNGQCWESRRDSVEELECTELEMKKGLR